MKVQFYIKSKEKFGFKYFIYLKIFYWYNEISNKYSSITCAVYAVPSVRNDIFFISHNDVRVMVLYSVRTMTYDPYVMQ